MLLCKLVLSIFGCTKFLTKMVGKSTHLRLNVKMCNGYYLRPCSRARLSVFNDDEGPDDDSFEQFIATSKQKPSKNLENRSALDLYEPDSVDLDESFEQEIASPKKGTDCNHRKTIPSNAKCIEWIRCILHSMHFAFDEFSIRWIFSYFLCKEFLGLRKKVCDDSDEKTNVE